MFVLFGAHLHALHDHELSQGHSQRQLRGWLCACCPSFAWSLCACLRTWHGRILSQLAGTLTSPSLQEHHERVATHFDQRGRRPRAKRVRD